MKADIFIQRKEHLKQFLEKKLQDSKNRSLWKAIEILNLYHFDNRLNQKGTLTHFILDSAELDYSIGEKIIEFDKSIS